MRKKGNPEFFEVFRRLPEAEKSRSWWSKKSKPAAPRPAAKPARDTTTPPGRVALTFSREALAVFVPLLVITLVVSHVWGYKRGVNNMAAQTGGPARHEQRNELAQRPAVEQYALSVPAGQPANASFVTLQLISLKSGQRQTALDLAAALCADNYDAFVRKLGSDYTVNVGRFNGQAAAAASGLKERFAPMTYMRQRNLFKTCLYVQVTGTGSILK